MTAFVAHPSVRVKGTEQSYTPVLCQDDRCAGREKGVHMHCPLCTLGEPYQDPIILRAHFRIKHVDKSIDFAGLKVLRCCNHCEIVGTIKGEKKFKGAHWHCYRCRNGFNRRDEAIKHYKTHFRNPHTTFQIQVTQDVNCRQYYSGSAEAHPMAFSGLAVSLSSVGDTMSAPIITSSLLTSNPGTERATLLTVEPKEDSESNGMLLGAEEEVGSSQDAPVRTQTLVLMDADGQTGNLIYDEATGIVTEQSGAGLELEKRLLELSEQVESLHQEKETVEKALRAEIKQLKDQVASLVQSNVKMFEELQMYQCLDHSQQRLANLMDSLQSQHKELLQAQLVSLRQEIISQASAVPLSHAAELKLSSGQNQVEVEVEVEVQDTMVSGMNGLEIIRLQVHPEEGLSETLVEEAAVSTTAFQSVSLDLETKMQVCRKRSPEKTSSGTSESKVPRVS